MTPQASNTWSDSLQQQTREAIEQIPVTRDGNIHFKNPTLGYAFATPDDLMDATLMCAPKQAVMRTALWMLTRCWRPDGPWIEAAAPGKTPCAHFQNQS
jgi:hypothetical protein